MKRSLGWRRVWWWSEKDLVCWRIWEIEDWEVGGGSAFSPTLSSLWVMVSWWGSIIMQKINWIDRRQKEEKENDYTEQWKNEANNNNNKRDLKFLAWPKEAALGPSFGVITILISHIYRWRDVINKRRSKIWVCKRFRWASMISCCLLSTSFSLQDANISRVYQVIHGIFYLQVATTPLESAPTSTVPIFLKIWLNRLLMCL